MSNYQPGDVCIATVRGVKDVRVFRQEVNDWTTGRPVEGWIGHNDRDLSDIRRLIVLDLAKANFSSTADVVSDLRDLDSMEAASEIADQIEAQTKSRRISEPSQWGVVEASTATVSRRRTLVRDDSLWRSTATGGGYDWDELVDPVLVREGVES